MTTADRASAAVPPSSPTMREHLALAIRDLRRGTADWRIWLLLGMTDIRQRYRRSRIGQFWITLTMAVTIAALGVVYGYLFHMPVREYLPYLASGTVAWALLAAIVTEACVVFTTAEAFLRQVSMPKSVFVHRMLVRNLVIFAHNAAILPPLYIALATPLRWTVLLALPGVVLIAANGVWIGLLLGPLCARFRDLPQLVASIVQIAFFVTPVMWAEDQLPREAAWIVAANPFAAFLSVLRDPLLGRMPSVTAYAVTLAVTILGFLCALPFFARFRARIVFWL
jgi:ABC-type polysaccharide/polyol phosphate export permease